MTCRTGARAYRLEKFNDVLVTLCGDSLSSSRRARQASGTSACLLAAHGYSHIAVPSHLLVNTGGYDGLPVGRTLVVVKYWESGRAC